MEINIISIDSSPSVHDVQEPNDIQKISQMEEVLEDVVNKLECLAKIEKENVEKVREQNRQIEILQQENSELKAANDNLVQVVDRYLKKLVKRTNEVQERIKIEDIEQIITSEERINEKIEKISQLNAQNVELVDRNDILLKENQDLSSRLDKMTNEFEKVNKYIVDSFQETLQHKHVEKIKQLEAKLLEYEGTNGKQKKRRNRAGSQNTNLINGELTPKSPVVVTRSKRSANDNSGRKNFKYPSLEALDYDDEEDINYNGESVEESFTEDEEDFSPKKGGKKKGGSSKKFQTNKKLKKNENKELLVMNKNTIQYHLFG